jgi:hypothetical protein
MCFSSPSVQAPAPTPAPSPPPPPPAKAPTAPEIDPAKKARDAANANRSGTSIFRNDVNLNLPGSGSVGNGLNIPK